MLGCTINNQYDKRLWLHDIDIEHMISHPSSQCKEQLMQYMFISLKDPNNRLRDSRNYGTVSALVIEYDNGVSIGEICARYDYLYYYLHTTSGHTKEHHKFRMILPCKDPIPYAYLAAPITKQAMIRIFPGIDSSCFTNFQKIPAWPKCRSDYVAIKHEGRLITYDYIDRTTQQIYAEMQKRKDERDKHRAHYNRIDKPAYKKAVDTNMQKRYGGCGSSRTGHRYTDLLSYCGSLCNAKYPDGELIYSDDDISSIILSEYKDDRVRKMVYSLIAKRI